jgi:hypothetical protein
VEIGLADDEIEQAPEGLLGEIETLGSDEFNDAFSSSRLARRRGSRWARVGVPLVLSAGDFW